MSAVRLTARYCRSRAIIVAAAAMVTIGVVDRAMSDEPYHRLPPAAPGYTNAHHMDALIADPDPGSRCRGLGRQGTDYVAGVDVFGNRVISAETTTEVEGGDLRPEPYFEIVRRMPRIPGVPRRAPVGEVTVDAAAGQSYFNGVPLDAGDRPARDCSDPLADADRQ